MQAATASHVLAAAATIFMTAVAALAAIVVVEAAAAVVAAQEKGPAAAAAAAAGPEMATAAAQNKPMPEQTLSTPAPLPETPRGIHWMRTTSLLLVLVLLLGGAGAFYWYTKNQAQDLTEAPLAAVDILGADQADAAAKARQFLQDNPSSPYAFWMSTVLARSTFDSATDSAGLVEGVKLMKSNLANATTPYQKAIAVNAIATAVFNAYDAAVYEEAFRDSPLRELRVATSSSASLEKLVEYSVSQYPTPDAYILLARQTASALIARFKPGSTDPINTTDAARSVREARTLRIVELIRKADQLAAQEAQNPQNSPYELTIIPGRSWWSGFALGAAALVNPDLLPQAERRLKLAIDASQTTFDAEGKPYPILESIATNAEFAYARLLNAVARDERKEDIRAHLASALKKIEASPEFYAEFYASFDGAKDGASVTENKDRTPIYRSYMEYTQLSASSPEFKTLLLSRGWDL